MTPRLKPEGQHEHTVYSNKLRNIPNTEPFISGIDRNFRVLSNVFTHSSPLTTGDWRLITGGGETVLSPTRNNRSRHVS